MSLEIFNLSGKVALVTGGSKGLGKAMARGLAEAGADVIITSRNEVELKVALEDILKGTKSKGHYIVADMSQRDEASRLAKTALERALRVDVLINNAGTNIPQEVDKTRDEDWDRVMEINLGSVMALTRGLIPQMKNRLWGRIVNISSIMGFVSKKGRAAYSATKSGLIGLTRALALELGDYGITANCIAPGPFLTDLPAKLLSDAEKRDFSENTALRRWADPKELVGPVLLLSTEAGSYITGETLVVDGGWLAR